MPMHEHWVCERYQAGLCDNGNKGQRGTFPFFTVEWCQHLLPPTIRGYTSPNKAQTRCHKTHGVWAPLRRTNSVVLVTGNS